MYSNTDRTQLVIDLTWAAEVQDARAICRLANHGLDMGIIDADLHSKLVVLGGVILDLNHKDGAYFADLVAKLARNI